MPPDVFAQRRYIIEKFQIWESHYFHPVHSIKLLKLLFPFLFHMIILNENISKIIKIISAICNLSTDLKDYKWFIGGNITLYWDVEGSIRILLSKLEN